MYNKSITSLLNGARIVTYDGSPFYPDRAVLLRICEEQRLGDRQFSLSRLMVRQTNTSGHISPLSG